MEEFSNPSISYQNESAMESNDDSRILGQYAQSNSYQNEPGMESNDDSRILMESNVDSWTLAQYAQSNSCQNGHAMESNDDSSWTLDQYPTCGLANSIPENNVLEDYSTNSNPQKSGIELSEKLHMMLVCTIKFLFCVYEVVNDHPSLDIIFCY